MPRALVVTVNLRNELSVYIVDHEQCMHLFTHQVRFDNKQTNERVSQVHVNTH
jgi:hypothetical protein